jgi:hypothetical protein
MAITKQGRKPLKKGEALKPIRIFVKEKHLSRAIKDCAAIAAKYR